MVNSPNQVDPESRTWGMIAHLSTFSGYIVPFGNVVGPLVVWLMKKDEMEFVDDQAKEALNFQISILIYIVVSLVLFLVIIGIFLLAAVLIFDLIVTIMAAVKANEGVRYRYPLKITFIS